MKKFGGGAAVEEMDPRKAGTVTSRRLPKMAEQSRPETRTNVAMQLAARNEAERQRIAGAETNIVSAEAQVSEVDHVETQDLTEVYDYGKPRLSAGEVSEHALAGRGVAFVKPVLAEELETESPPQNIDDQLKAVIARADAEPESQRQRIYSYAVLDRARQLDIPAPVAESLNGRWFIKSKLGQGAQGDVYEAYDFHERRTAALKIVVLSDVDLANETLRRFEREAKALQQFSHKNIVKAYAASARPEGAWLAMEKVEGETLEAQVRRGAFTQAGFVSAGIQMALGLSAMHKAQRLHRDVKPANILFDEKQNTYKIADFGLIKEIEFEKNKFGWVEQRMREVIAQTVPLKDIPLAQKDRNEMMALIKEMGDRDIQKQFADGKLRFKDFDRDFTEHLFAFVKQLKLAEYGPEGVWTEAAEGNERLILARALLNRIQQEGVEGIGDMRLRGRLETIRQLQRDPYIITLASQQRFDELEYYLQNNPLVRGWAHERMQKSFNQAEDITAPGTIGGTPMYMAPERFSDPDNAKKPSSDVWSLGLVFREMLTQQRMFQASDVPQIVRRIRDESVPAVDRPDIQPAITELVASMTDRDPKKRPTMEKVVSALLEVQMTTSHIKQPPAAPPAPKAKPSLFRRLVSKITG